MMDITGIGNLTFHGSFTSGSPICPDLLTLDKIGEADNLRGRIVRAVFWVIDRLMPAHHELADFTVEEG